MWAKGNQQIPPLCCDRSSNVDVSHLIYLDEFVHRDVQCSSKIRCEYAYSIRQGLRVLSARGALHAGRDQTAICLVQCTSPGRYLSPGCCRNSCRLPQVLQNNIFVTGASVVWLMDKSGQRPRKSYGFREERHLRGRQEERLKNLYFGLIQLQLPEEHRPSTQHLVGGKHVDAVGTKMLSSLQSRQEEGENRDVNQEEASLSCLGPRVLYQE